MNANLKNMIITLVENYIIKLLLLSFYFLLFSVRRESIKKKKAKDDLTGMLKILFLLLIQLYWCFDINLKTPVDYSNNSVFGVRRINFKAKPVINECSVSMMRRLTLLKI